MSRACGEMERGTYVAGVVSHGDDGHHGDGEGDIQSVVM